MRKEVSDFVEEAISGESTTTIYLPSGPTSISKAAEQIFTLMSRVNAAFYRGGKVHEVVSDSDGRLRMDVVLPEALRSRVERLGLTKAYIKNQKGEYNLTEKRPNYEDCKALLATLEARSLLNPIANVYAAPVLVLCEGQPIFLAKGYHREAGGTFVCSGDTVPDVGVVDAAGALDGLLCDFLFVTDSDRTRALSTILSPALRFGGFIRNNCPQHTNEADQPQTGKGYNLEMVAAIYGERPALATMKAGGVGSYDESMSQRLIDGRPFIQSDNLRGKLDSQFLEAVLTAPGEIGCRVPHRGEVYVDPRRYFFTATSNGFEATSDLANRSCIIRLRKQPLGYAFKRWPEGGLIEHVRANQAFYLGCVHSLVRAWWAAGAPRTEACEHDFRDWAQTVEGIIYFAWPNAAPLLAGHRSAQARTANPGLAFLRAVCLAVEGKSLTNTALSASAIAELCAEQGVEIPGLRDPTNEDAAKKQVGMILTRCLKDDSLVLDEYEVTRRVEQRSRQDGKGTFSAKSYVFRRSVQPA